MSPEVLLSGLGDFSRLSFGRCKPCLLGSSRGRRLPFSGQNSSILSGGCWPSPYSMFPPDPRGKGFLGWGAYGIILCKMASIMIRHSS